MKLIGSVTSCITGLIKMLINAIITQTSMALEKFSTEIPGTSHAIKIIASAYKIHEISKDIIFPFFVTHLYFKIKCAVLHCPKRQ